MDPVTCPTRKRDPAGDARELPPEPQLWPITGHVQVKDVESMGLSALTVKGKAWSQAL